MKQMNRRKGLLAAALVVILLTFAVSGTIAYLKDSTDEVTNTFTPSKVDTEIEEGFTDNTKTVKSSIAVTNPNTPESIDAYVRVAVMGNWCNADGEIVEPWSLNSYNTTDWVKIGDYYYYKNVLAVGKTTDNLLSANIASTDETNYPGLHLEVSVMQQAIQAEPKDAVTEMWGVTLSDNGMISGEAGSGT